jgi:hypothetical protein
VTLSRDDVERWWDALPDEDRQHLRTVGDIAAMNPETQRIVATLPGLKRIRGSFQGKPLPEAMPEPLRSFVREKRLWRKS